MPLARAAEQPATSNHWPDTLLPAAILVALALAYARTLAPGITWANSGSDGGDLVTATATLGIAHPSGYPTYLLLARLFHLIPAGDLAFRSNLFSAASALLAVLCAYALVRRLLPAPAWHSRAAAGLAALALGLSPLFWSQAIITEVYSLNACFVGLLLLFTLRQMQHPAQRFSRGEALQAWLVGITLGNHLTIALPAAAWLFASTLASAPAVRWRLTSLRLLCAGAGLLVYLYLPLRAAAHPPVNWGTPDTWQGFWWVLSGQPYRHLVFGLPPALLPERLQAWAALLLQQAGVPGVVLGFAGLLYARTACPRFVWLSAALAGGYSLFAISYNSADSYAYLIPVFLIFAVWAGLGSALLFALLEKHTRPAAARLAVAALLLLLLARVPATLPQVDASSDQRAAHFARRVLQTAPPGAVVLTAEDRDTFALWYEHYALGKRPDLLLITEPLLAFAWYRDHLRAIYPRLRLPEQPGTDWAEAIRASSTTPPTICRTLREGDGVLTCEQP